MNLPRALLVDLDGTLCNHDHRLHFVDPSKDPNAMQWGNTWIWKDIYQKHNQCSNWTPRWQSFYDAMDKDTCPAILIFVTGRPEKYSMKTRYWLYQKDAWNENFDKLFMRPECVYPEIDKDAPEGKVLHRIDSSTPAHILKEWIYETEIKDKYDVLFVLEDSQECAEMYRSKGLTVLKIMQ